MAEFLDNIIDSDAIICDYVDGSDTEDKDIYLPQSDFSLAEWNDAVTYDDGSKREKISLLPNHGRIQLAIHRICREQAAEKTRKIALSIFKQFFYAE